MDLLNLAMLFVVPASAIWVYFDAVKNDIGHSVDPPDFPFGFVFNRSPGAWAVLCLFFWIPFFAFYVALRPRLTGTAPPDAPHRGILFGACFVLFAGTAVFLVTAASVAPPCDDAELMAAVGAEANAQLRPLEGTKGRRAKARTCTYSGQEPDGSRWTVTAEVTGAFGGYRISVSSAPEMPECKDDAYLRQVEKMLAESGLKQLRVVGEGASNSVQRTCRLLARDPDGGEVRLTGAIIKVGKSIQFKIDPE